MFGRTQRGRSPVLIVALALAVVIAGCTGSDDDDKDATNMTGGPDVGQNHTVNVTVDPLAELANASFDAPDWQVGKWWAHHMFFGPDDSAGTHTNVFVVEDAGDAWVTATENEVQARRDAQEDLFNLGSFAKTDLAGTFGGADWKWYDWPLSAESSWHQATLINGNLYHTDYRASFAAEIPTAQGNLPGFIITGTTAQGDLVATWDFVPELGWFANLEVYDRNNDPDNPYIRVINMGFGDEKPGQNWVIFEPAPLISHSYAMNAAPPEGEPLVDITVPEGTNTISGTIDLTISSGAAKVTLEDPDGKEHSFPSGSTPASASASFDVLIEDVVAGDWTLTVIGAGQEVQVEVDLIAEKVITGTLA